MDSQKIIQLRPESFILLVKQLRHFHDEGDLFEVDLDNMRVKGDLRVIQNDFDKPIIGRTSTLDMAKRAAKATLPYVRIPVDLELDDEFRTLVKNKGTTVLYIEESVQ